MGLAKWEKRGGKKTAAEERDGVECCELKKRTLTIGRESCWLNRRSGYNLHKRNKVVYSIDQWEKRLKVNDD